MLARALAASALCLPLLCTAQSPATKPGLWEMSTKISGSPELDRAMAEMQKQLAAMPPEQRKQMQAMMGQAGLGALNAGTGGITTQICLSKEMIARGDTPYKTDGDCTHTKLAAPAGKVKFSFQCAKPKTSGQGEFDMSQADRYSGTVNVTNQEAGQSKTMTIGVTGKFLSADCGSIKPLVLPK